MEDVDEATRAALLFTRYHARTALGAVNEVGEAVVGIGVVGTQ